MLSRQKEAGLLYPRMKHIVISRRFFEPLTSRFHVAPQLVELASLVLQWSTLWIFPMVRVATPFLKRVVAPRMLTRRLRQPWQVTEVLNSWTLTNATTLSLRLMSSSLIASIGPHDLLEIGEPPAAFQCPKPTTVF